MKTWDKAYATLAVADDPEIGGGRKERRHKVLVGIGLAILALAEAVAAGDKNRRASRKREKKKR